MKWIDKIKKVAECSFNSRNQIEGSKGFEAWWQEELRMNGWLRKLDESPSSLPEDGEGWISADQPPKPKENWKHTDQCLVWYEGIENDKVEGFGIAYYNYEPPFKEKGQWVDFAHYGRQPKLYKLISAPGKPAVGKEDEQEKLIHEIKQIAIEHIYDNSRTDEQDLKIGGMFDLKVKQQFTLIKK